MGIDIAIAKNLLELSKTIKPHGRVLTLGRQQLHLSPSELDALEKQATEQGLAFPRAQLVAADLYSEPFFKMLGFEEVFSIDASSYENCDYVHSLDQPVPTELRDSFDFIYDGGTTEHIFDLPVVYKNVFDMLRSDAVFYSVTPANDFFGHGFFQFGPELPWSLWREACGFDVLHCIALPKDVSVPSLTIPDPKVLGHRTKFDLARGKTFLSYAVRKSGNSVWQKNPQQSDYVRTWDRNASAGQTSKTAIETSRPAAEIEQAFKDRNKEYLFPVRSQTKQEDREFLLATIDQMRQNYPSYSYLEVGSFLGGSLAPFLLDNHCSAITSIDDRGKTQNDERGLKFDYGDFSTQNMLLRLKKAKLPTSKLTTFDGNTAEFNSWQRFDLVHIDAIHTDEAVFADYLACRRFMKPSGVVLFHDYDLVFKGVEMVRLLLESEGVDYSIALRPGSFFCGVFLGACAQWGAAVGDTSEESRNARTDKALRKRILEQFANRAIVQGDTLVIGDEETRLIK